MFLNEEVQLEAAYLARGPETVVSDRFLVLVSLCVVLLGLWPSSYALSRSSKPLNGGIGRHTSFCSWLFCTSSEP